MEDGVSIVRNSFSAGVVEWTRAQGPPYIVPRGSHREAGAFTENSSTPCDMLVFDRTGFRIKKPTKLTIQTFSCFDEGYGIGQVRSVVNVVEIWEGFRRDRMSRQAGKRPPATQGKYQPSILSLLVDWKFSLLYSRGF